MDLNEVKKPENEKLYSTQEVATFMGISYITLYRLVKCGKIKALNISPKGSKKEIWRFRAEDVQSYYDNLPKQANLSEVKKDSTGEGHTEDHP